MVDLVEVEILETHGLGSLGQPVHLQRDEVEQSSQE